MDNIKIIIVEVADVYKKPSFKSEITTQALLWEKLIIIDKKKSWFKVKQWDDYIGWVHEFNLIDSTVYDKYQLKHKDWYIVNDRIAKIYNKKQNNIKFLSLGTILPVLFTNNGKSTIILPDSQEYIIDEKKLFKYNLNRSLGDMMESILSLVGTPYKWGGKTGFGFDCSGLTQMIFRMMNINIPRDSSNQIKSDNLSKVDSSQTCDLIFFKKDGLINHVGLFINENEYIHSSGQVKINSINPKDKNFDIKLNKMIYGFYRFKK